MTSASPNILLSRLRVLVAEMTAQGQSDAQLLEQFVDQRNEAAFAALMERHGSMAMGVIRRIVRDEHLAEDVFQATFLVLARNAAAIRKRDGIGSWLHGVALRLARKAVADAARGTRPDGRPKAEPTDQPPADLSWREVRTILDDELHRLPEKQRLSVLLCLWEGRTVEEAAVHLGWAAGQVKGHLQRGRSALRARLIRRGVSLSALAAVYCADTALASAVPPLLTVATFNAAIAFSAGETLVAGGASGSVIALTQKGLSMISAIKAKLTVAVSSVAIALGFTAALLMGALDEQPQPPVQVAKNDNLPVPAKEGTIKGKPALVVQSPPERSVLGMVMSRDGKWLVTGSADGTAGLWDVASGNLVRTFKERAEFIQCVALSKDQKWLACASNGYQNDAAIARVWDLETGKQAYAFKGHVRAVTSVAFSEDGLMLATGSQDRTARLWNLAGGKEVRLIQHDAPVTAVFLSPDGKRLVTGSERKPARMWDAETGKEIEAFGDGDATGILALSGDGNWLATSQEKRVHIWNVPSGKLSRSFATPDVLRRLQISHDGKTLATNDKKQLRLWDTVAGIQVNSVAPEGGGDAIALSNNGTQIAVLHSTKPMLGHTNNSLAMWDMTTGKLLRTFPTVTQERCRDVAITSDSRWLATTSIGAVQLWDLTLGRQVRSWKAEMSTGNQAVAFSSDGKWLVAGDSQWDAADGKLIREFPQHQSPLMRGFTRISSAEISNDNRFLVTVSGVWTKDVGYKNETAGFLFDVKLGKRIRVFAHNGPRGGVPIIDANSSRRGIVSAALTADGSRVITGGIADGKARMWSVSTGEEVRTFSGPAKSDTYVALSADGKYLATTSGADHSVLLWDLASGKEIVAFQGHDRPVCSLQFSADGNWLVTGSIDRTVRLWDVASSKETQVFRGHTGAVSKVALTEDCKRLVTSGLDDTVRVWDVAVGKELCQLISFNKGDWAVVDAQGRFDASNQGNVEGLHWVIGNETFPLSRFKDRFYDPGLLAKHMGFNQEPVRKLAKVE
jgi:RNA polymerase sigma factor (sigma-70 family)